MNRESEIRARQNTNAFRGLAEWQAHAADDIAWLLDARDEDSDLLATRAEEIRRLDAEVVRLRTALRDVSGKWDAFARIPRDDPDYDDALVELVQAFRVARAALGEDEG